jgi:hypothetical protein
MLLREHAPEMRKYWCDLRHGGPQKIHYVLVPLARAPNPLGKDQCGVGAGDGSVDGGEGSGVPAPIANVGHGSPKKLLRLAPELRAAARIFPARRNCSWSHST